MSHLRVSVLIPTYNRAAFLSDAIESLLAQTRVPDEIIVVDDGSSDDTERVLGQYAGRIQALRQSNQGPSAARNAAFRASSGDLIAFLDSDDTLAPTSIEQRAVFLEAHPKISFVYTGAYMTDIEETPLQWFRKPPLPQGNVFHEVICRPLFPIHAVMLRRSIVDRSFLFDERLRSAEDTELWAYLTARHQVAAIELPLSNYRSHPDMITERMDQVGTSLIAVQEQIMRMPEFRALPSQQQGVFFTWYGMYHLYAHQARQARGYLVRALRCAPTLKRPYVLLLLSLFGSQGFEAAMRLYRRANTFRT